MTIVILGTIISGGIFISIYQKDNPPNGDPEETTTTEETTITEFYKFHDPIKITSDAEFLAYAFPGTGNESDPLIIEKYNITSETYGIRILKTSYHFIIRDCLIDANMQGIYITQIVNSSVKIHNNTIIGFNQSAITLIEANYVEIYDHQLKGGFCVGITLSDSDHCYIHDNFISIDGWGISLESSYYCKVENNYVEGSMIHEINFGIAVGQGLGIKLRNNHVLNCVYGFYIYHSNYGVIENNLVENCERGVHFQRTHYTNFTSNTFVNNSLSGVYIERGNNNTLTLNEFRENNVGVDIYESKYNLVANNSFIQNYIGLNIIVGFPGAISYVRCEYTTAKFNLFYNNTNYGVRIARYPYFSHIFLNTFYLNNQRGTSQAYDYGTETLWFDYSLNLGNYWSDWDLIDEYIIDGPANNTDPFPFIYNP